MQHVNQPAGSHVHERVDPQRRKQEEELTRNRESLILLVACPEGAEDEGGGFPGGGHDDDPAEAFAEDDGEDKMCEGQEAEEDGESEGGGFRGRVGPLRVAGSDGDVALGVGGHGYT